MGLLLGKKVTNTFYLSQKSLLRRLAKESFRVKSRICVAFLDKKSFSKDIIYLSTDSASSAALTSSRAAS